MAKRFLLIAAAVLALAPGAAAQPGREGAPVAGPTPSGARMVAFDHRGSLCIGVRGRRGQSSGCSSEAPSLGQPRLDVDDFSVRRRQLVLGAVVSEVAAVEVVFSGGRRVKIETTEGARYRGRHAGDVRFFLAEVRADPRSQPFYVRQLDQTGALLAAVEVERGADGPRLGAVRVGGGRIGGERWRLDAFRQPRLVPLPGDEERVAHQACVLLRSSSGRASRGHTELAQSCVDPDGVFGSRAVAVHTSCNAAGLAAVGLAAPGTRRMVAVLGDGRRLRVPLRALPARFGGRRAFALVVGPRTALRRLVAFESGGARVLASGVAPGMTNCPNVSTGISGFFFLGELRFEPGGPALQVRDQGVLLCSTIGVPRPLLDCARPPLDAEDSRVYWNPADSGTFVAGVVAEEVTSVAIVLDGGERHVLPATTEGPYTGRYRGVVRFFTASFPGERTVRRTEFLGAGGEVLARAPVFGLPVFEPAPVPVLRARGGWRLGAGVWRVPGTSRRFLCVQLARGEFRRDLLGCIGGSTPSVEVTCRPRAMFVYGRLPAGMQAVRVETDRGVVRARIARLPASLGVRGRVFLAAVPARARPSQLVFEGRRERRARLRLPAAASQCGYGHWLL